MATELNFREAHYNDQPTDKVEPEMRARSGSYPLSIPKDYEEWRGLLDRVLTQAFVTQPFVGNVTLSTPERDVIHTIAEEVLADGLKKFYLPDYGLKGFYCDVILLETVLLLRNWSSGDEDSGESHENIPFWEYLFNQFGLSYESGFGSSHEYRLFRHVTRASLENHQRLFISRGKRYYTTLLIHALAPLDKFNALFDQIFAFYAKTLEYQYLEVDPAFRAFVFAMKRRFDSGQASSNDDVYIRSVQSSSAIKALFQFTPGYMCGFVEVIVSNMDTLVTEGTLGERSYLDTLLLQWYRTRSREVRLFDRQARTRISSERPVKDFAAIRFTYSYEAEQVIIVIPSIRLGEQSALPTVEIYRDPGDEAPYSQPLRCFGDVYRTSARTTIPLTKLIPEAASRLELRALITIGDATIYDSGTNLYREAIIYDDEGREISNRPNKDYVNIFVPECAQVDIKSSDYYMEQSSNGFTYRVLVDDQTQITVNQTTLFGIEKSIKDFTLSATVLPVEGCAFVLSQQPHVVFASRNSISIKSDNVLLAKQYRVVIDGVPTPLSDYYQTSNDAYKIDLPDEFPGHQLQIVNNANNMAEYTLHYVIIAGMKVHFYGFCYLDNCTAEDGFVEVLDQTGVNRYSYNTSLGRQYMLVPYREGELALEIPTLGCYLDGKPLSLGKDEVVWYEGIPRSTLLQVIPPRGHSCKTVIANKVFEEDVELGNEIRTIHNSELEPVNVKVYKGNGPPANVQLFQIAFKPQFKSEPLYIEDKHLLWCVEKNFVGDLESRFNLCIYRDGSILTKYSVGCADMIIPMTDTLDEGWYDYVVSVKRTGHFTARYDELRRGCFLIGDSAKFRFYKRTVIVTHAIIAGQHIELNADSGIITHLNYIGELGLNGEKLRYSCYEGRLQYLYQDRLYSYATEDYVRNGVEQVNPVRLWVINDYVISLRTPFDDGLYVHSRWKSITDRTPTQSTRADYINPDYYSFKTYEQMED